MTTESDLQPAREQVQTHIQKTVAVSALRKIHGLVDEYEEEKRRARRMTPIGIALVCFAVVGVFVALFVFRFAPEPPAQVVVGKDVIAESGPRPLRLTAGAGTSDNVPAEYSEKFRIRIENVGAKQFPPGKRPSGSVTLSTHIRTEDGTVARIEMIKPSGQKELDDAAQKVVMSASPFPPPSDELKKKAETIVITRQFNFTKD